MADGRIDIDTRIDTSGLESGIKRIQTILSGAVVTKGLAMLKSAITDISKETEELNDSVRAASMLFQGYEVDIDNLTKRIQTLSSETGVSASAIGNGLYTALSASIPPSEDMGEALDFVRQNAIAAQAGFAELTDTINTSASVLNAYSMNVSETERVLGILMQTQNKGITTIGELSTSLASVIPTAASFGVEFEQIGAAMATMTAAGTQARRAATGLNSLLSELGKQGQTAYNSLLDASEAAGLGRMNFEELTAAGYSLGDILNIMAKYAESTGKNVIDLFGNIESGRAALQLARGDAEKFNENLAAMSDTTGLVDDAFDKVLTNTDKLRTAFTNAKSTIGNAFAPVWDKLAGALASGINIITGNRDAAGELESAFTTLESAIDAYTKAQTEAAGATDILTKAMEMQKKEAMRASFVSFAKTVEDAFAQVVNYERQLGEAIDAVQSAFSGGSYRGIVLRAGFDIDDHSIENLLDMFSRLDEITAEMRGVGQSRLTTEQKAFADLYEQLQKLADPIEAYNTALKSFETNTERAVEQQKIALQSYADLFLSGVDISYIDLIGQVDESFVELFRTVESGTDKGKILAESLTQYLPQTEEEYKALVQTVEESLEEIASSQGVANEGYWETYTALQALKEKAEELGIALKDVSETQVTVSGGVSATTEESPIAQIIAGKDFDLSIQEGMFKLLGDEAEYVASQMSILESTMQSLLEAGLDPADELLQELVASFEELSAEAGEIATKQGIAQTIEDWNEAISDNIRMSKTMGDNFDLIGEQISATEDAIEALIYDFNLDPASEQVQYLVGVLEELKKAQEDAEDASGSLTKALEAMGESIKSAFSSENIASALTSSLDALVDTIINADDAIAELEEENLEYTEKLLEAKETLADAQARNDEEAIAAAEELIAGYQALIDANNDEIAALESGEEAWNAFAQAGLEALAEVLIGLGEQLAAQAITSLLSGNWVNAALATAGSVAAYAAGYALKATAGSFEQGGIVPYVAGVPLTGDNLIANVNPGELILNRAQQENLSAYLASLEAQREEAAGESNTIIVSMSGAYIYGLNEPAVGRAIYDNIKTLQSEGVLR